MVKPEKLDKANKRLPQGLGLGRIGRVIIGDEIDSVVSSDGELISETVRIPRTAKNTDVILEATEIRSIIDVKYVFPDRIRERVRINKASINGVNLTLNASMVLYNSYVILIGIKI